MTIPIPAPEERLQMLMSVLGDPGNCRGCAAAIKWITHRNGKKTPYDAEGPTVGTNHFITCLKSDQFRKK
jgi:hypothetical protein